MTFPAIALLISAIVFMLLGVPIVWSIGAACAIACSLDSGLSLLVLSQKIFVNSNQFALLAIPAFFFAGDIMAKGGLSKRLVQFADALVGWIYGGISIVSLVACAFFAAISGSSVATTAAIGGLMYPEMVKRGYPPEYSAAVQAVGGTLGIVIPPSIVFVIYGSITGTSISELLMSGVIPGVFACFAMSLYAWFTAKKNHYPKGEAFNAPNLATSFKSAVWALLMPIIILGGIYPGIFTPTESAAVAVLYGFLVCLCIYREINLKSVWSIAKDTVLSVSNTMMLVATAQILGYMLTYYRIPNMVTEFCTSVISTQVTFLLMVIVLLILCGMFMEIGAINTILAPILAPIAIMYGINPVHFGCMFVFLLAMGQATPPFGTTMFVAAGLGNIPVTKLIRSLIPYIAIEIACALLFAFVPQMSLAIPSLMG